MKKGRWGGEPTTQHADAVLGDCASDAGMIL